MPTQPMHLGQTQTYPCHLYTHTHTHTHTHTLSAQQQNLSPSNHLPPHSLCLVYLTITLVFDCCPHTTNLYSEYACPLIIVQITMYAGLIILKRWAVPWGVGGGGGGRPHGYPNPSGQYPIVQAT